MRTKAIALLLLAGAGLTPIDERGYGALIARNRNRILLVSFWATWCEPCRVELPQLAAMERQFPSKDFQLAVISIDEPEFAAEALRFWTRTKFQGRGYIGSFRDRNHFIDRVDPRWSGALPALFLYDRSGRLVKTFTGEVSIVEVEQALRAVSAEPKQNPRVFRE